MSDHGNTPEDRVASVSGDHSPQYGPPIDPNEWPDDTTWLWCASHGWGQGV